MKEFNAIDLFAGCGGLSLGLSEAGFNILYANEINKTASKTYELNLIKRKGHKTFLDVRDISKVSTDEIKEKTNNQKIHLVAGGPPCQGFSMAGRRDIKDSRNKLFKEMLRVVKEINPPLFVLENVKGILSMQYGKVIKTIKESFEKLGYEVKIEVLKASKFGVPQDRERVFVIGTRIGNGVLHPKPNTKEPITVIEAIGDLSFLESGEKSEKYKLPAKSNYQKLMRKNSKILLNHESSKHSEKVIERFSKLKQGQTGKDLPEKLKTKKQVLKRLEGDKPAKTVTTLPEDYIHYSKNRILTVRETARIQSFPDDFEFIGPRTTGGERRKYELPQYSQIGNAVPPILAKKVGEHLIKCLKVHSDKLPQ
jgi:DNA (cytosine-5)-methyltransferase 1